jgi:hypothetical protein
MPLAGTISLLRARRKSVYNSFHLSQGSLMLTKAGTLSEPESTENIPTLFKTPKKWTVIEPR